MFAKIILLAMIGSRGGNVCDGEGEQIGQASAEDGDLEKFLIGALAGNAGQEAEQKADED